MISDSFQNLIYISCLTLHTKVFNGMEKALLEDVLHYAVLFYFLSLFIDILLETKYQTFSPELIYLYENKKRQNISSTSEE